MTLSSAIDADRNREFEKAAALYEELLAMGDTSPEILLNLACLYWNATDPGVAASMGFREFFHLAARRSPQLLKEASRLYPTRTDVQFWGKYIEWANYGSEVDVASYRQMLLNDPSTLLPAMVLYVDSGGVEAQDDAKILLEQSRRDGTTRARYVVSVLDSAMKRANHRKPSTDNQSVG